MIKAILFDFDDTLGNRKEYAERMYRDYVNRYFITEDEVLKEAAIQDCLLLDQRGNVNKQYVVDAIRKTYGFTLMEGDANTYWDTHLWQYVVLQKGTKEVLEILKRNYRLGIVTNGNETGQQKKIAQSGIALYFDIILISGALKVHKPDPRIFQKACEELQLQPYEVLFVGDTFSKDILGAYRAGLLPVWMKRTPPQYLPQGIHAISSLQELTKEWIEQHEK